MTMGHHRDSYWRTHARFMQACLAIACFAVASPSALAKEAKPKPPNAELSFDQVFSEKDAKSLIMPQMAPDTKVDLVMKDICEHIGLKCNFSTFPARVPNAMAYIIDGDRVIMYNPDFIHNLERPNGQPSWATLSVLVHEVGHHLLGHMFPHDTEFPARELEADRFSGFMLYRMGASLAETQANIRMMAQENETPSHPGRSRRLAAFEEGWEAARLIAIEEKELAARRDERSRK